MKATGIVRRVDDLGRIVIPKEIRRTLRIREGDPPGIRLHFRLWRKLWFGSIKLSPAALIRAAFDCSNPRYHAKRGRAFVIPFYNPY